MAGTCCSFADTVWESGGENSGLRQRMGLSYRMNYNISTRFGNVGGFRARTNPGPATGSNVDRNYDNGFNRVDVSGNAGGQTWYWGYNDASQIVGDSVVMSSRSSPGRVSSEASDDPQHGFEVTYNLDLGGKNEWRWGVEAAGNYTAINISDRRTLSGPVRTISDAFALNGVVPPVAPYAGTFNGPGVVIGSTPARSVTTTSTGATITGSREIEADVFGVRAGPYFEFMFAPRLAVSLSAGLAIVEISSDFNFNENVTISGLGTRSRSGSASDDEVLAGGYLSGNLLCKVSDRFSLFGGVQFYSLGTHSLQAGSKTAELDLESSLGVVLGGSFSF